MSEKLALLAQTLRNHWRSSEGASGSRAASPSRRAPEPWQLVTISSNDGQMAGLPATSAHSSEPMPTDAPLATLDRQLSSASRDGVGQSFDRRSLPDQQQQSLPNQQQSSPPPVISSESPVASSSPPEPAHSEGSVDPSPEGAAAPVSQSARPSLTGSAAPSKPVSLRASMTGDTGMDRAQSSRASVNGGPDNSVEAAPREAPNALPGGSTTPEATARDAPAAATEEVVMAGDVAVAPRALSREASRITSKASAGVSLIIPESVTDVGSSPGQPAEQAEPPVPTVPSAGSADVRGSTDSSLSKTPSASRRHEGLEPKLEGMRSQLEEMQRGFLSSPHSVAGAAVANAGKPLGGAAAEGDL